MTRASTVVTWGMARYRTRMRLTAMPPIAAFVFGCLVASCGGSGSASGGGTTTSDRTSSTVNSEQSAVLAAYRAGWQAFEQAVDQGNPSLPALDQTMTGAQLESVHRILYADQVNGIVGRGGVQLHPKLSYIRGNQALVLDCTFDSSELVYAATGKPVPPVTPPEKVAVRSQLTQVSPGTWKVADQHTSGGSCPSGY